jgi:predicted DCC family thiol-disulfide oxidoreductase YuxK
MKNGWTGGQYSLVRLIFGVYLCVHCIQLVPWAGELFSSRGALPDSAASPLLPLFPNLLALWDAPVFATALVILAAGLSVLLALGFYDRTAAVALWYLWACWHGRMPLIANPSLPYVGWLLLAHACLPAAPYGALAARGRIDPGNNWRMPEGIFLAAWMVMAVGYTYSGVSKLASPSWVDGTAIARVLENPLARSGLLHAVLLALPDGVLRLSTWGALGLELGFAPLALVPRLRPWLWGLLLLLHVSLMLLIDFADLSLGMIMLHLFTFDPAWLPPTVATAGARIFYDGQCGLCHRWVRFVLAEDHTSTPFHFAPLTSATFQSALPASQRAVLPESIAVHTADGVILTRSAAMLYVLQGLGGLWQVVGLCARMLPLALRDRLYDSIVERRYGLFAPPPGICPALPAHLRARFEV